MRLKRNTVKSGAFLVAAATVASGVVGSASPASADPVSLSLTYVCDYPLIGTKEMTTTVTADVPDRLRVGAGTGVISMNAAAQILKDTTEGLYTVGADTISGSIVAEGAAYVPSHPRGVRFNTALVMPRQDLPEAGDFQVTATGRLPTIVSTRRGWGRLNVGNLTMRLKVLNAAGQPTALGSELVIKCYQKPGANPHNTLAWIFWGGRKAHHKPDDRTMPTTPPPVYGTDTRTPARRTVDLDYRCDIPGINRFLGPDAPMTVEARMDSPTEVTQRAYTQRSAVGMYVTFRQHSVEGLWSLDEPVKSIEGSLVASTPATFPQVPTNPLNARIKLPIPKQDQPDPPFTGYPEPWTLYGIEGSLPPLVFTQPGDGRIGFGNFTLSFIARNYSGALHPQIHDDPTNPGHLVPVAKATCVLEPHETETTLSQFTIK
ncbi:DUF6801 domain-containing protein [Thermomonospora umbrina]|uniref:DUF6801 domain-containing protein n=1 Tax=Thermomonospora umbrina TaxID=111806 RepID=A0A3D9SQ98_9ACTN|nr:DUF6801 domain-containing protein [Thermomonospora umbrina]REE97797.1 hypothetical protein DFJ69_3272 [Thermomonospora umbrina]